MTSTDGGFTLIELMVVLLILAILLAIAIPTFLGVTKSANDRAAQANLNTALVNAKSIFQNNGQSYALGAAGATNLATNNGSLQVSLSNVEPNLSFTSAATVYNTGTGNASVGVAIAADGNGVVLVEQAKGTGNCWYIVDNAVGEGTGATQGGATYANLSGNALNAGTWYGKSTSTSATGCPTVPPSAATFRASGFGS